MARAAHEKIDRGRGTSLKYQIVTKMVLVYTKNADGEFTCPHCEYTARIQSTMHYHLKKHEGTLPHVCKHCDMRFLQKSYLDMHVKSRHADTLEKKDTFKCPCNNCGYEDIRKSNRRIHFVRVHLKPLVDAIKTKTSVEGCVASCSECNQSFKSMTQFYYHSAGCIKPTEQHPLYNDWMTVRA